MKTVNMLKKEKPTKTETVEIGSTTYIVNSHNDNFSKATVKKKIIELIKNDLSTEK